MLGKWDQKWGGGRDWERKKASMKKKIEGSFSASNITWFQPKISFPFSVCESTSLPLWECFLSSPKKWGDDNCEKKVFHHLRKKGILQSQPDHHLLRGSFISDDEFGSDWIQIVTERGGKQPNLLLYEVKLGVNFGRFYQVFLRRHMNFSFCQSVLAFESVLLVLWQNVG